MGRTLGKRVGRNIRVGNITRGARKFWDKVFHGDEIHPPLHCPNCGAELPKTQEHRMPFWVDSAREETHEKPFRGIGYDTYCPKCDWSGDIIPDSDRNKVHNIGKDGKVYEGIDGRDWHYEGEESKT